MTGSNRSRTIETTKLNPHGRKRCWIVNGNNTIHVTYARTRKIGDILRLKNP